MSADSQDSRERAVDATTHALEALHQIFDAEESLGVALDRTAQGAVRAITDADAVTITVLREGKPDTVAWTDQRYLEIDKHQYAADRGPCLEAARTHQPVRASINEHTSRWPEFAAAAHQAGIQAYLSVPLVVTTEGRGNELVGSLNLYSHTAEGFDPFDEALMRLFSTAATRSISNARRWQQSRDQVHNLETALESRAEIDQAKGVLMAVHQCTADEAFTKLTEQSQHRNVKLKHIAREFLELITRPRSRPSDPPRGDGLGLPR